MYELNILSVVVEITMKEQEARLKAGERLTLIRKLSPLTCIS